MLHWLTHLIAGSAWAYPAIVALVAMDGLVPMVPGEGAVLTASILAASGHLSLALVVVSAFAGALLGDNASYGVGRLLCTRALERDAFGGPLAEKQTVQNWIADSAAEIQACRLLTLDAAHKIDQSDEARVEISLVKFYAVRALNEVIDRAIQVHGGLGLTDRTPLAAMWAQARGGRIYDGPDEVHRMVVSRRILKDFAAGGTYRFS